MNQDRLQAALDRVREAVFDDHFEARVACMEIHRALQELYGAVLNQAEDAEQVKEPASEGEGGDS